MFTFLLLFCTMIVLIFVYLRKDKDYWRKRHVIQIDSALRYFLFGKRSLSELFKEWYDRYPHEKYIGLIMGSKRALLLKDLKDISFVLQGDFHNFHSRGIVTNPTDLLADNLLFMNDYYRWKLLRQKITPVFTHKKLKNMFYIIEKCAHDFANIVEENEQLRINPFNALYTYTTASIGASVFGIDTLTQNTMDSPFIDMSWKIFHPDLFRNLKMAVSSYSTFLFRLLNLKVFGEHEKFFIGVMKRVLEIRRKSMETRYDFIDTCLEIQQNKILRDTTTGYELKPSDEVLAAQAFFFFIAGVDTSATAMNYTLLELSNNPPILRRLHEEIDKVLDNCKGILTYEDVKQLQYLDMVINESMRKYPPVGIIQRKCMNDTILPSGLNIEKNTTAFIPIFALHRDDKYYPQPEVFDPERFSPDNISDINKDTYLPFGGGNRVCIGLRFARLQMKAGLALLLHRFTLVPQNYKPVHFSPSFFSLRDPNAKYELILRD